MLDFPLDENITIHLYLAVNKSIWTLLAVVEPNSILRIPLPSILKNTKLEALDDTTNNFTFRTLYNNGRL